MRFTLSGKVNRMEIHKPKPVHSLREFLTEIGTIVCGILIALVLEQAVETARWRHEVAETRKALNSELALSLGGFKSVKEQEPCIGHRLAELSTWYGTGIGGKLRIDEPNLNRPVLWIPLRSAWEAAKSGQVASHFPLEERVAYAKLYDQMLNSGEYIIKERDAWNEVLGIDGSKSLSSEDRSRLYRAITLVRSLESSRRQANSIIDASAAELRIDPSLRSLPKGRSIDDLCQPLWR
jgi:hypothetical protein